MKKPLKTGIFLLVLALITVGLAFILLRNMDNSGETGHPITIPVPKTTSVAKPISVKKIDMTKIPQPSVVPQNAGDNLPEKTPPSSTSEITVSDIPDPDMTLSESASTQTEKPSPAPETETGADTGQPVTESSEKISPDNASQISEKGPAPDLPETISADKTTSEVNVVDDSGDDAIYYSLYNINFRDHGRELEMKVLSNGPLNKYKFFILSKPSRIVIDLYGQWHKPPFWEKNVATRRIAKLRVWRYKDKLRIVGDLKSDKTVFADFTPVSDGIVMTLR